MSSSNEDVVSLFQWCEFRREDDQVHQKSNQEDHMIVDGRPTIFHPLFDESVIKYMSLWSAHSKNDLTWKYGIYVIT